MNQLEWGSDLRGIPLPVADAMESLFNSTFDHNGPTSRRCPSPPRPTCRACLTMLFTTWLSGGNAAAVHGLPQGVGAVGDPGAWPRSWACPSPATSFGPARDSSTATTAARPVSTGPVAPAIRSSGSWPTSPCRGAELNYFPGGGNSVTFITPGGIDCIAARLAYSDLSGMFSLVWDEATTVELPAKLAHAVAHTSNADLAAHLDRAQVRHDGRVQAIRPGQSLPRRLGTPTRPAPVLDGPRAA